VSWRCRSIAALFLLLPACVTISDRPYTMVSDSSEGVVIWNRFRTAEACEQARQASDMEMRCTTWRELQYRPLVGRPDSQSSRSQ